MLQILITMCIITWLQQQQRRSLQNSNFVLGNAQATGCPVVYCSDGFCELTGYPRAQAMGRSCACKFLYGEDTAVIEKGKIDEALDKKLELKTELNFYKKSGTVFKCLLDIVPIKNEKSQVVLILVSHKDISTEKIKEKSKKDDNDNSSGSDIDSDEDMAEAYKRSQARCSRSSSTLPGTKTTTSVNSQRRRSRAVLYHLSGQFEKPNRAKSKLQQFNKFSSSISGKMPEYKVQEVKKSKFILVHYGIFKIGWDWLILLCTFYTAVMVPYNAAFTLQEGTQRDSIYSDVVVEILFMVDIVLNFRTSYVNRAGQVVYQARLIAINYIRGWFLLDLLAAIPFDFLYIFKINAKAPVHLLKVARLIRLARLLQKIDRFSQYSALVLALLMSMFALLAHWMACIWYAIGNVEFQGPGWTAGWLYELGDRLDNQVYFNKTNKPDLLTSYLTALYFTVSSLTSVGFGNVSANTNSEKIFSICAMLIGALMHAAVFGNVTALIQRMYQRRANFHSKTKDLKDFFRAYEIPKPLKQRMQEYFQTMWSMNNGIETNEILKDFPDEMKGELGLHLHKEMLNLAIFEDAPQGCLKSIALHTKRAFCAPGEFLVHKGDAATYLYLLSSGSMEILKADMVVAILGKGDLFGSNIDFDDPISVCNYDVRSLTYSELQGINIKGLTDVLILYPEFAEKFSKDIYNDLTYNLRQTVEESDEEANDSPKERVCTLPSISEDDEETDSDEDAEATKSPEKPRDHEEEQESPMSTSSAAPSISSPLLPNNRPHKLPNGDIDVFNSPPTNRNWARRGSQLPQLRSSFKERSKLRLGGFPTDSGYEKVIPHVQNLHNEIEGTKGSICKLEKKVNKIGQDICALDSSVREILKIVSGGMKLSPTIESLPPTPNTAKHEFMFDRSETDDSSSKCETSSNPHVRFAHAPTQISMSQISFKDGHSTLHNDTREQQINILPNNIDCISDKFGIPQKGILTNNRRIDFKTNTRNDELCDETSRLLNPHEPESGRHDDDLGKCNMFNRRDIILTKDLIHPQSEEYDKGEAISLYKEIHVNGCNAFEMKDFRTPRSESCDVSPDSTTDVSDSFKTDSILTEDDEGQTHHARQVQGYDLEKGQGHISDTVIDFTSPMAVTHVHKRLDGLILRTTDL